MPRQVKPVIMFLILDFIYMRMKKTKQRKLLIIDESWSLLGKTEEASYIFEIVKTCRKFNLGLLMITQDVADLLNSRAGHAVLANSSYSLLLRQKPSVIDQVVKTFHLSKMEKDYLLTANQGKGILIMDNEHQELSVIASPKEHKIITTNPDEIIQQETKIKEKLNVDIDLNIEQEVFLGKDLSEEQKNYLGNHNYFPANFVPIGKVKQQEFWIKKNKSEGLEHTFLVNTVADEFKKIKANVETKRTQEADIIVQYKKFKPIAIEIETGTQWTKNKKNFKKKFEELKQQYKDRLFVVLSDAKFKPTYKNNLPDIKILLRKNVPELVDKIKKLKPKQSKG